MNNGKHKKVYFCLFKEGETPLIKATKMRNIEIVELLLDKGAKVSAVDKVRLGVIMVMVTKLYKW